MEQDYRVEQMNYLSLKIMSLTTGCTLDHPIPTFRVGGGGERENSIAQQ